MMQLVMAFYNECQNALGKGAAINDLLKMPVRERIGRYKYIHEDELTKEFNNVMEDLNTQIANVIGKEEK